MVVETVIGCVVLTGAAVGLLTAIYRRSHGSRHFGKWLGGGKVTFTGAVAGCIFIGCVGAAFLHVSAIWVIPALSAWFVGYVSQNRANRRHQAEEEQLRNTKARDHPGVFDGPPPTDLDAIPGDQLDLYDAGACTYIGPVCRSDMKATINAFAEMPDQGSNDIFIIYESLERLSELEVTQEFITLLNGALTQRDYLLLRWMPQYQNAR
jgi:hypothetical protein